MCTNNFGYMGYDQLYIALGHFHNFYEIKTSVPACYPGTPEGLGFNDTGSRGVVIVDLDKNGVKINPNNINSRVYEEYELECSDLVNEAEIERKICEHSDPNKLLRVKLFGVPETLIKLDSDALLEEIKNSFFHLEIIDNITSPSDLQVDNTIKGTFITKMQGKISGSTNPEEKKLLERALRLGIQALDGGEIR